VTCQKAGIVQRQIEEAPSSLNLEKLKVNKRFSVIMFLCVDFLVCIFG